MKKRPTPYPFFSNAAFCAALAVATLLTGCKKPDEPISTADTSGRISRIIRENGNTATHGVDTLDLEYNADGSVREITRTNHGLFSTTTFRQPVPNTIVREELSAGGSLYGRDSFLLDAQGRKYEDYSYNTISRATNTCAATITAPMAVSIIPVKIPAWQAPMCA